MFAFAYSFDAKYLSFLPRVPSGIGRGVDRAGLVRWGSEHTRLSRWRLVSVQLPLKICVSGLIYLVGLLLGKKSYSNEESFSSFELITQRLLIFQLLAVSGAPRDLGLCWVPCVYHTGQCDTYKTFS